MPAAGIEVTLPPTLQQLSQKQTPSIRICPRKLAAICATVCLLWGGGKGEKFPLPTRRLVWKGEHWVCPCLSPSTGRVFGVGMEAPTAQPGQKELLGTTRVLWFWAGDLKEERFSTSIFMRFILRIIPTVVVWLLCPGQGNVGFLQSVQCSQKNCSSTTPHIFVLEHSVV